MGVSHLLLEEETAGTNSHQRKVWREFQDQAVRIKACLMDYVGGRVGSRPHRAPEKIKKVGGPLSPRVLHHERRNGDDNPVHSSLLVLQRCPVRHELLVAPKYG